MEVSSDVTDVVEGVSVEGGGKKRKLSDAEGQQVESSSEKRLNTGEKGILSETSANTGGKGNASESDLNKGEKEIQNESSANRGDKVIRSENSFKKNSTEEQASGSNTKAGEPKPKSSNEILSYILRTPQTSGKGNENVGENGESTRSTSSSSGTSHLSHIRLLKACAQKIKTGSGKDQQKGSGKEQQKGNGKEQQKEDESEGGRKDKTEKMLKIADDSAVPQSLSKRRDKSKSSLPAHDHFGKTTQPLLDHSHGTLLPLGGLSDGSLLPPECELDGTLLPDEDLNDEGTLPVLTISDTFITSIHKGKVEMIVIPSTEEFKCKIREDQIRVERNCESVDDDIALEGPEDQDDFSIRADGTMYPYQGNRIPSQSSSLLPKTKLHHTENVVRTHVISKEYSKEDKEVGGKKDSVSALRAVRVPVHNLDKVKGLMKQLNANSAQQSENQNFQSANTTTVKTRRYTSRDFDFIKSSNRQKDLSNIAVNRNSPAGNSGSDLKRPLPIKESEVTTKKPHIDNSVNTQHKVTENKGVMNSSQNTDNLTESNPALEKQPKVQAVTIVDKKYSNGNVTPKPSKESVPREDTATKNNKLSNRSSTEKSTTNSGEIDSESRANTKQDLDESKSSSARNVGVIEGLVSKSQDTVADSSSVLKPTSLQNKDSSDKKKKKTSGNAIINVTMSIVKGVGKAKLVSPSTDQVLKGSGNIVQETKDSTVAMKEGNSPATLPETESADSECKQDKAFPNLVKVLKNITDNDSNATSPSSKISSTSTEQTPNTASHRVANKLAALDSVHHTRRLQANLQPQSTVEIPTSSRKTGSPLKGKTNPGSIVNSTLNSGLKGSSLQGENHSSTDTNKTDQNKVGTKICEENISDLDLLNLSVEEVVVVDSASQGRTPSSKNSNKDSEFVGFPAAMSKEKVKSKQDNLPIPSTDRRTMRGKNDSFPVPHGENFVFLEKTREDCPMCYTVIDALEKYISEIMGTPKMNFSGLCEFKDWCKETQAKARLSSARQAVVPKKKKDKLPIMAAYRKASKPKKDKGTPDKGVGFYKTVTWADSSQGKNKFADPKKTDRSQREIKSPFKKSGGQHDLKRFNREYLKDRNAVRFVALNNKGEVEVRTSF